MPNRMHLPFYFSTRNWRKRRSNPLCSAPTLLGSSGVCSHPMLLQPETRVLGSSFCSMVQDRWPGWWSTPHLSILLGKRGAGVPGYEWTGVWQGEVTGGCCCPASELPMAGAPCPGQLSSCRAEQSVEPAQPHLKLLVLAYLQNPRTPPRFIYCFIVTPLTFPV